ncbi:flippase [Enterococcus lactis]|uniref:flippase n=1 Tax=Enterococcus TaxID=1350 RepID=UPI00064CDC18|nr:flippase [Enterococcus faecium]
MKIVKNYLYSISYQLLTIILPIVTVPYVSRVLTAEGVGKFSYTNSIIQYFILLATLGTNVYGSRTIAYYRNDIKNRSEKFIEIMLLKFLMMIVSFSTFIVFLFFYRRIKLLLLLQSFQILAVGVDISWFFIGIEDFKKTVFRNTLIKIASVVLIFLLVKNPEDLWKYIVINSFSTLIGNFTLWGYLRKYIRKVDLKNISMKTHIPLILKLFIPQIATQIFVTLNKIYLGNMSTFVKTGFFDNSDRVVRILIAFITAIGTVIFPRLANEFHKNNILKMNNYFKIAFDVVNLIAIPISLGMFMVSRPFSVIFFGEGFQGIDKVLAILSFEIIFMGWSSLINQYLIASDKPLGITISISIASLLSIFLSYYLIKEYSAIGAAVSSVIGEFVIAISSLMFMRNNVSLKYVFKDLWKIILSALFMFFICRISQLINPFFSKLYVQIFLGGLVYLCTILVLNPEVINYAKKKLIEYR